MLMIIDYSVGKTFSMSGYSTNVREIITLLAVIEIPSQIKEGI